MTHSTKHSSPADHFIYKLPDKAVQLLHQLGEDDKLVQFALGDLAAELVEERGVVPAHVIHREIAKEHGSEPSTIRDRERVSRLVPVDFRDRFPALRFHQWRAVCSVEDKTLIPLIAALACVEWANPNGRPATVLQIRRRLRDGDMQEPAWMRQWSRLMDIAEAVAGDEEAPSDVRALAADLYARAQSTLTVTS